MRVRLVLDVLEGRVVRGVAGRRSEYQPIESVLTSSTAPLDVATAFRERLGITSLYVADLDGLVHGRPDLGLLAALVQDGFDVQADVGVRSVDEALRVAATGAAGIVCALETLPGPRDLAGILEAIGGERTVFSLDLKGNEPLRASNRWPKESIAIARRAIESGVKRMIALDLAAVGTGTGVPTLELCREIHREHPAVVIVTGGGVRTAADLESLATAGIDEALVASAVHDGRLGGDALALYVS